MSGTSDPLHTIEVALGARSYRIVIGAGLLRDPTRLAAELRGRHVLTVSNAVVAPLYLERVERSLVGRTHAALVLPDGEAHKTLASAERVFEALAAFRASRDATVIALGGGVVGDLAGFAAACWMRGVAYVQVPTTLLAMVDSSIGGKTAVNLAAGKNLIGAFHQPRAVLIDTDTLATLPGRELRAGLAEVVKYGAIGDPEFFAWMEARAAALLAREPGALGHAIATSCRHKAGIVMRDEREDGERALLNFGHTFGHAIESATAYTALRHGEAVAIGMACAAALSTRLGMARAGDADRLVALLQAMGLPTEIPADLDPAVLLDHMRLDKKAAGGRLRLILWRGIGQAEIVEDVADAEILAVLGAIIPRPLMKYPG